MQTNNSFYSLCFRLFYRSFPYLLQKFTVSLDFESIKIIFAIPLLNWLDEIVKPLQITPPDLRGFFIAY